MKPIDLIHPTWQILDGSKIKEYMTCPRKFFYRYLVGWAQEEPSIHLVFGEAWHLAMEHLLIHGYTTESIRDAWSLLNEKYKEHIPESMEALYSPKTPGNALQLLIEYCERWKLDDFTVLHTETGGTFELPDGLGSISFRLDSILEDERGIFTMDHKTGSRDSAAWEQQWYLDFSISNYTNVLYCMYPPEKVWGAVMNGTFFRKGDIGKKFKSVADMPFKRVLVRKNFVAMQEWYEEMLHWVEGIRFDEQVLVDDCSEDNLTLSCFVRNTNSCTDYGRACEYHHLCTSWANPLRKIDDGPPIGFKQEYWDPLAEAKACREFVELPNDNPLTEGIELCR